MSFPYIGICRPVETAGVLSLSLSYALSQTHDFSMGHWAVVPMGSGCWVAVSGWELGGEGVGKRGRGGCVQHWRVKVT